MLHVAAASHEKGSRKGASNPSIIELRAAQAAHRAFCALAGW